MNVWAGRHRDEPNCLDFSDAERASGDYVQPLARGNVLPNAVCFTLSSSDSATEHELERDPVLTKDISLP